MGRQASDTILEAAAQDPGIKDLLSLLSEPGTSAVLSGARGGAPSVALAQVLRETNRPAVIVSRDLERARAIAQDLEFLIGAGACAVLPEIDLAVYASGFTGMATRAARIETLSGLATGTVQVVAVPVESLMLRVPRPDRFTDRILRFRTGDRMDLEDVARGLVALGYSNVPMVEEHGDFGHRGGIIDFYSFGRDNPVRVEFDDDRIASLREFEVGNQRSVHRLETAAALPIRELLLDERELEDARPGLIPRHPNGEEGVDRLLEDFGTRRDVEGAYWLAGLFPDKLTDLTSYFPDDTLVVIDGPKSILDLAEGIEEDYRQSYQIEADRGNFFAPPEDLFLFRDDLVRRLSPYDQLILPRAGDRKDRAVGERDPRLVEMRTRASEGFGRNLNLLRESLTRHRSDGRRVLILCDSDPHRERLEELMEEWPVEVMVGNIGEGFTLIEPALTVMTDHEIWGRPRRRERSRRFKRGILATELQALKPGDYVVHIEHGVGIYRGMERITLSGREVDCLLITYAKDDKLYVPTDQLDLVQRYSGGEGAVPNITTLGGTAWQKLRSRAKKRIKIMADELIQTYARRKAGPGYVFPTDGPWQHELEAAFEYDETPDQLAAIQDVKTDMESERPMDRLVCGDVGYGKTEVAIRAAFTAVVGGKQVAILVPTTLLAEQHFTTFRRRLEGFPMKVEMLSRFRTTAEQKKVVEELNVGQVDIVIGTHRLLSKDIGFHDLGLLVVDEEQRFGVRHKEIIKKLRTQVDVLTLTATPIPRTLHMSLVGAHDMSMINTPPRDRLPIHTEIVNFEEDVIVDALLREADRGGQSFFVHNRVQTIQEMGVYLGRIVPELRIAIAHGQMSERQLERVMADFLARKHDVLLTTMIIESGLDIPTVNTILINRADAFGLAQLYQLRGRIGRSARRAYAYLLVPRDRALTETAQKRLRVIDEMEELGSGFQLAMRDLEIRGAGNILGAEQHGFIVNIGFDLYCRLLDEAVRELKGLPTEEKEQARVTTDIDAFLPDKYVPNRTEKVKLYKKLADASDMEAIREIEAELRDRFGPLPHEGQQLLDLRRLRVLATEIGAKSVILRRGLFEVLFGREMTKDEVRTLLSTTSTPVEFSATGEHGFRITRFREASVTAALGLLEALALMHGSKDAPVEDRSGAR